VYPDSPGPAKEGWSSTGEGHDPGESDAHHGVGGGEAEVSHGLADNDVTLYGQDHQGPEGNLACRREGKREGGSGDDESSSWLGLPFMVTAKSRGDRDQITSILLDN